MYQARVEWLDACTDWVFIITHEIGGHNYGAHSTGEEIEVIVRGAQGTKWQNRDTGGAGIW